MQKLGMIAKNDRT